MTRTLSHVDIRDYLLRGKNMLGPLAEQPDIVTRLQTAVDNPTPETWEDAYSLMVGRKGLMPMTLWQAVLEVARAFPATGPASYADGHRDTWAQVPSRELLLIALRWATMEQIVLPTTLKGWPVEDWRGQVGADVSGNDRARWYLPGGYFIDREPKYLRSASGGRYTAHLSGANEHGSALRIGAANTLPGILEIVRADFEQRGQCPACKQVRAVQDVSKLNYQVMRAGHPPAYRGCRECQRAVSLGRLGS